MHNGSDIQCDCGSYILKSYADGVSKLRSMLLIIKSNSTVAKCRSCKREHVLPITVSLEKNIKPDMHLVFNTSNE
jgi:hypothetical protein